MKLLQVYDFLSQELEEVRDIFDRELCVEVPAIADMIDQVGMFRGKMLRPILVFLCGKVCGEIKQEHRIIAAVIEMVHMATLVHDDVVDEADVRRRGQTINALHGNEAAVLLGDLLVSHSFRLCSSLHSQLASKLIAATVVTMCEGELMQLYYRGYYEISEERYLEIVSRKTGSLLAMCCYLGAQAAGADENVCRAMEKFGMNTGIAFQIMDDIIDITGEELSAGKNLRRDMAQEKITLPGIHFLHNCSAQEARWACHILQERQVQEYQKYIEKLRESGSIEYASRKGRDFIEQAKQSLPMELQSDAHDLLADLAESLIVV